MSSFTSVAFVASYCDPLPPSPFVQPPRTISPASIERPSGDFRNQLVQRLHARAIGARPEVGFVQQHAAQTGIAGADDVDVVEIADVNRRLLARATARQGDLEQ